MAKSSVLSALHVLTCAASFAAYSVAVLFTGDASLAAALHKS